LIRRLDLSSEVEAAELLALQKTSYTVEAELIGSSDIPPLKETLWDLMHCGEAFYGCFKRGRLVGAISYKKQGDVLDVHRLVVHPDRFRRGIGRSLVLHLENVEGTAGKILVSTGAKNYPARKLYLGLGFRESAEAEVAPGLYVSFFEKEL
jgi:ribosomal protein S18 acetylase RimI-like enzyme